MQNGQIPDSALSASTSYSTSSMPPGNGRLHFQSKSGKYGAWAVSTNDKFQWFLVDFGSFTKVTALSTQGRQDGDWWVKTYSLSFSYDGVFFQDYQENNVTKVTEVLTVLSVSVKKIESLIARRRLKEAHSVTDILSLVCMNKN